MMLKVHNLTLITGGDIELKEHLVKIRQPIIKEIALIGEDKFFRGLNIFRLENEALINFIQSLEDTDGTEKALMIEAIEVYDSLLFLLKISTAQQEQDKLGIIDLTGMMFKLLLPDYDFIFKPEEGNMFLIPIEEDKDSILIDRELFRFERIIELKDLVDARIKVIDDKMSNLYGEKEEEIKNKR